MIPSEEQQLWIWSPQKHKNESDIWNNKNPFDIRSTDLNPEHYSRQSLLCLPIIKAFKGAIRST